MTTIIERPPLTDRQRDVLDFIAGFTNTRGYPPTVREIANHYGWKTTNATMCHLLPMRKKGWVTWEDGCARTLRVVEQPASTEAAT